MRFLKRQIDCMKKNFSDDPAEKFRNGMESSVTIKVWWINQIKYKNISYSAIDLPHNNKKSCHFSLFLRFVLSVYFNCELAVFIPHFIKNVITCQSSLANSSLIWPLNTYNRCYSRNINQTILPGVHTWIYNARLVMERTWFIESLVF